MAKNVSIKNHFFDQTAKCDKNNWPLLKKPYISRKKMRPETVVNFFGHLN